MFSTALYQLSYHPKSQENSVTMAKPQSFTLWNQDNLEL